uniref:Alpha-dioxygenase 1 n=1 Tax=Tanacetum cinerariifolium TaxID=118510 RepID=A0A6L2K8M2_TANCI|nr:alpha-dioxygenase 1 [Tanacetum cinerariifolium]
MTKTAMGTSKKNPFGYPLDSNSKACPASLILQRQNTAVDGTVEAVMMQTLTIVDPKEAIKVLQMPYVHGDANLASTTCWTNISFLPHWEDLMDDEEAIETFPEVYGDDFEEFNLLVGMADEKKTKGFVNNKTTSIICFSMTPWRSWRVKVSGGFEAKREKQALEIAEACLIGNQVWPYNYGCGTRIGLKIDVNVYFKYFEKFGEAMSDVASWARCHMLLVPDNGLNIGQTCPTIGSSRPCNVHKDNGPVEKNLGINQQTKNLPLTPNKKVFRDQMKVCFSKKVKSEETFAEDMVEYCALVKADMEKRDQLML